MLKKLSITILVFTLGSSLCYAGGVAVKKEVAGFDKEAFISSAKEKKVLQIGLVDCIAFALKNNSEIKIKRIEPKIKEDDVRIEKSDFEPTLNLDATYGDSKRQSTLSSLFGPSTTTSTTAQFNAGIEGEFITGTKYNLDFKNTKYKSNSSVQVLNPYYQSDAVVTITQPLLKGAGIIVNKADIIIAQNNKGKSVEEFKNEVMDILSKTKIAYYDYIFFIRRHKIASIYLDWTRQLLDIVKARYAKGEASSVDVIELESAVAEREKDLVFYESALKKSEDELKFITNLVDDENLWNAEIEPIDQPELLIQKADLVKSLEDAFQYRPDYIAKKIELKSKDIKVQVAKNALFPTVDLVGSLGLNGLGDKYREALNKIDDRDYRDWSVGVEISIPWGGGDRADFNKKKLEKMQELLALKRLEQNIILDVRDKVREIDIQYRQVEATKLVVEKQTENYAAQEKRYKAGELNTHDLLDYRFRLELAKLQHLKALIDYNIALINLDKAQGLTLVKNDITLEGEDND